MKLHGYNVFHLIALAEKCTETAITWTGFDPLFRAFVVYRGEPTSAQLGQGTLGTGVYQ